MVEGHQCHRVAAAHRKLLVGKSFQARSPNGRFKEGAAAINAKPLTRIEVHGKNLFYFFGGEIPPQTQQIQQQQTLQPEVIGTPVAAVATAAEAATTTAATPDAPRRPSRAAAAAAAAAGEPAPAEAPAPKGKGKRGRAAKEAGEEAAAVADEEGSGDVVVMHVHFGMSGAFRTMELPGLPPTDTTRLELLHKGAGLVAHLSAMTVAHGGPGFYVTKAAALGQDPLREDADKEVLWAKVQKSKKPIGLVLMDQTLIAGVGNIYRAEILYKARVHPEAPASSISREQFDRIWYHCVDLLQRGFVAGSIITVDPQDAAELGKPWTRRYIYNQKSCGRCKGSVRSWDMAGRTVYCCETCQPLKPHKGTADSRGAAAGGSATAKKSRVAGSSAAGGGGKGRGKVIGESESEDGEEQEAGGSGDEAEEVEEVQIAPARRAAMAAARTGRVFVSHCAPDDPADVEPAKLTVKLLKERLIGLNLDTRGTKPQLVARLEAALRWQQPKHAHDPSQPPPQKEEEMGDAVKAEQGQEQEAAAVGAADAAPATPTAPQSKRARGEGAAAPEVGEQVEDVKDGKASAANALSEAKAKAAADGDGDSDSAVTLDRAEQALTDRMAPPPAAAAPAGPVAAAGDAAVDPAASLRRHSVAQLRLELQRRGMPSSGVKATLVERLAAAMATEGAAAVAAAAAAAAAAPESPVVVAAAVAAAAGAAGEDSPALRTPVAQTTAPAPPMGPRKGPRPAEPQSVETPTIAAGGGAGGTAAGLGFAAAATTPPTVEGPAAVPAANGSGRGKYDITPGIQGLRMTSAKDAALEKLLAGENRAVEHVALEDDEVVDLLSAYPVPSTRKRARALQELEQQQQQ